MKKLTYHQRMVFWIKSRLLICKRLFKNYFSKGIQKHRQILDATISTTLLSEIITPLYTETKDSELELQLGKIQNLRVCANYFNGTFIPKGQIFSFWQQLGRPSRSKGFVIGRELRQGCLIPTIAGGICQFTNSLYQAAKQSNMIIIERHGHTQKIEGATFGEGEDATVFWNYIDLRFQTTCDILLKAELTTENLVVQLARVT